MLNYLGTDLHIIFVTIEDMGRCGQWLNSLFVNEFLFCFFFKLLDLGFGEAVISITSKNATDFQFSAEEFFS